MNKPGQKGNLGYQDQNSDCIFEVKKEVKPKVGRQ